MRIVLPLLAAITLSFADTTHAQPLPLHPGTRVRAVAPTLWTSRYEATIGARRGDTLYLVRPDAAPIDVPLSALTRLDLSLGRSRKKGALRGIAWGAAAGVALGLVNAMGNSADPLALCGTTTCRRDKLAEGGALVLGSVVWGAGIGALVGRETWKPVIGAPAVVMPR